MVFSFISLADPQTITGHSKKWDWDPYSMGIVLREEWLLCANLRQILRLIISQVCLGEQDSIPQISWGSNKRITVGTLLGLLHPIGRLDLLCRSEALPCSLVCTVCQGGDRHHTAAVMNIVELSAMCFDWTHFDSKEKLPKPIFQPPGRLFILFF